MDEIGSLDAIFREHYPRLVRTLGTAFEATEAADAVQEAFIAADRRWSEVSGYADPVGWIRRVAINRLLNVRRNRRRRLAILSSERPIVDGDLTDDLMDLRRAFMNLPPRLRLTASLFYLADLPVEVVAEEMGISINTVKSNLHHARTRLRQPQLECP